MSYRVYCGNSSEAVSDLQGRLALAAPDLFLMESGDYVILSADSSGESVVVSSGDFSATKSVVRNTRARGYAAYVKLYNETLGETWSFESLRVRLSAIVSSRGRSA